MGFYVNPTDMMKEEWFQRNMQRYSGKEAPTHNYLRDDDLVACVLVHNGAFTALGIAYCQQELEDFAREDGRPKIWAYFPRKIVEPYLHGQRIEGASYE